MGNLFVVLSLENLFKVFRNKSCKIEVFNASCWLFISSIFYGLNVFLFTVVSFFSRGLRFYLLSFLLKFFGEKIEKLIDKYFNILAILFFVLLVAGIVVVKYI